DAIVTATLNEPAFVTGRSVDTVLVKPLVASVPVTCTLTVAPAVKLVSPVCGAPASAAACVTLAVVNCVTIGIRFDRFQRTPRQRPISAFISASVSAYVCERTKGAYLGCVCSL